MQKIFIQTNSAQEVQDITDKVQKAVTESIGQESGVVNVHVMHTTAALSTADLDPGTDQDMLDAFKKMAPSNDEIGYRHPHNPEHTPDHILSTLIGMDVNVPVEQGSLVLGTWQHIVLFEFDGPRERTVVITVTYE